MFCEITYNMKIVPENNTKISKKDEIQKIRAMQELCRFASRELKCEHGLTNLSESTKKMT